MTVIYEKSAIDNLLIKYIDYIKEYNEILGVSLQTFQNDQLQCETYLRYYLFDKYPWWQFY